MSKNQHVVPYKGKWAVRGAGNSRRTKITQTQGEAMEVARKISRNQKSELLIHGRNGRVRAKHSYGNDPYPPKG